MSNYDFTRIHKSLNTEIKGIRNLFKTKYKKSITLVEASFILSKLIKNGGSARIRHKGRVFKLNL